MRVFAHPLRIDAGGSFATVEQGGTAQAGQLAKAVVATFVGERPLAPDFGIPDPTGKGVGADSIIAAMGICEPDLEVVGAEIDGCCDVLPVKQRFRVSHTLGNSVRDVLVGRAYQGYGISTGGRPLRQMRTQATGQRNVRRGGCGQRGVVRPGMRQAHLGGCRGVGSAIRRAQAGRGAGRQQQWQ